MKPIFFVSIFYLLPFLCRCLSHLQQLSIRHTVWNQYQDCLLVCTNWFTCRPHLKNVGNSDFLLAGSKTSCPITTSSCYVLLFLQVSGVAGIEKQTHILMNTKLFFPVITFLVYSSTMIQVQNKITIPAAFLYSYYCNLSCPHIRNRQIHNVVFIPTVIWAFHGDSRSPHKQEEKSVQASQTSSGSSSVAHSAPHGYFSPPT